MKKRRFVLLDRDGTIIVERNYLSNHNQVKLIPKAASALKKLSDLGLGLVVMTNQSGIGRGYFDLNELGKIHNRMIDLLAEEGVRLDGIYFCPHIPEDNCLCRKPKVGLVEKAVRKHNFDPKLCFVIGDNKGDIELGKNIGAKTILVRTGHGRKIEREVDSDYVVDNLKGALSIIKYEMKSH